MEPHGCQGITEPQCVSINRLVRSPVSPITGNIMAGNQAAPKWALSAQAWKEIKTMRQDNYPQHCPVDQQLQQQVHQSTEFLVKRLEQAGEPSIPRVLGGTIEDEKNDEDAIITHDTIQCLTNCTRHCECRCHDSKAQRYQQIIQLAREVDVMQLQMEELVVVGIATDYIRTRITSNLTGQNWEIEEETGKASHSRSLLRKRRNTRRRKSQRTWHPSRKQQNKKCHATNGNEEWLLIAATIVIGAVYVWQRYRRNGDGPDNREMHAMHGNIQEKDSRDSGPAQVKGIPCEIMWRMHDPLGNWIKQQWRTAFKRRQRIQVQIREADRNQMWLTGTREQRAQQDLHYEKLQEQLEAAHREVRTAREDLNHWLIFQKLSQ